MPARLGTSFRWLLASSWVSNIGDGVIIAAGPLLVASETREPFLVALAWMLQYLPWLVFGLFAGVVADRVNRKTLITVANACRVVVLTVLVGTIVTGHVSITVVLASMFLLGVGETFADTTTATLLPMVVARKDLGIGNARLLAGTVTLNQLVGPPVGALLFGAGRSWPFVTQAVCIAVSILLAASQSAGTPVSIAVICPSPTLTRTESETSPSSHACSHQKDPPLTVIPSRP